MKTSLSVFIIVGLMLCHQLEARAETVSIGILTSAGIQKTVYMDHKKRFETANPGITLDMLFRTDAEFKELLPKWLDGQDTPNIVTWQGGQRLYQYAQKGLVKDLSNFYQKHDLHSSMANGAVRASTLDGKQYGIPLSYYQWGFYYRASVFEKLNLSPPKTWDEFISVGNTLKQNDIIPITIGAKFKWPTAAWFDYLNLRINGLDFHQALLQGEYSFTDPRVRTVFEHWKQLIDQSFFVDRFNGWTWLQSMPFMYHKMAGMTLMGNFFAGEMPRVLKDDFRFFKFPVIDSSMNLYEEAPMDLFMVPANTQMTPAVEKVLLMLSNVAFQQDFNETAGMISPHLQTRENSDYFIKVGQQTLNAAKGVSQFFDRDSTAEMATLGTETFTQFLSDGDIDKAINALEVGRKKYLVK